MLSVPSHTCLSNNAVEFLLFRVSVAIVTDVSLSVITDVAWMWRLQGSAGLHVDGTNKYWPEKWAAISESKQIETALTQLWCHQNKRKSVTDYQ